MGKGVSATSGIGPGLLFAHQRGLWGAHPRGKRRRLPDAGGARARSVAGLAWRGTHRRAEAQSPARSLPVRGDGRLASQPADRQRQE